MAPNNLIDVAVVHAPQLGDKVRYVRNVVWLQLDNRILHDFCDDGAKFHELGVWRLRSDVLNLRDQLHFGICLILILVGVQIIRKKQNIRVGDSILEFMIAGALRLLHRMNERGAKVAQALRCPKNIFEWYPNPLGDDQTLLGCAQTLLGGAQGVQTLWWAVLARLEGAQDLLGGAQTILGGAQTC